MTQCQLSQEFSFNGLPSLDSINQVSTLLFYIFLTLLGDGSWTVIFLSRCNFYTSYGFITLLGDGSWTVIFLSRCNFYTSYGYISLVIINRTSFNIVFIRKENLPNLNCLTLNERFLQFLHGMTSILNGKNGNFTKTDFLTFAKTSLIAEMLWSRRKVPCCSRMVPVLKKQPKLLFNS